MLEHFAFYRFCRRKSIVGVEYKEGIQQVKQVRVRLWEKFLKVFFWAFLVEVHSVVDNVVISDERKVIRLLLA